MKNILPIFIIAICTLTLIGCQQEEIIKKEVIKPVKVMQVEKSSGVFNFKTPGTVRASKRAELSFDVPGRIVMLNAKEGAMIKKGDVIAKLDDRDYKNKYQSAKANLKEAKATFERYSNLIKEKAISKSSMDKAEKIYEMAVANMKVAEKAFNDTKLKAYFSGTISARHVENFQNIQAKQSIVSIEDKTALEIVVNIPEIGMVKAKKEDIISIHASFAAIPDKKFPLEIKEFSEKVDSATRTYAAVLSMATSSEYNLLSGMTTDVDIRLNTGRKTKEKTILIPVTAVMGDKENNSYAWVYSDKEGAVSKRKVIIGKMTGKNIHIVSGLNFEETIVIAGVNYLVEGMKVRPLKGKVGEAL